ncbi:MAG: magnesium chelatase subunit I [Flavobacteriales bacterium]|jgi:magnesium chelatase subunit I
MQGKELKKIKTLGGLKKSGYKSRTIGEELRSNLIERMQSGKPSFDGIVGFEDTVIPDIERAILSKHNINLLGLRGQAKTRIARSMTGLLDEYIPVIEGSDLNDDPLDPISGESKALIAEMGDKTPVAWMHRHERFVEKLATPDVSVADLIGDVDPIKASNMNLDYADERVIHFGLIPRSHRCIFVLNELPDLQPRIQVSLFNILQEGDVQIRGFKLRLPLDIRFVFTANPEDYTNRGSIITPLKDRVGSQILTHYPREIETARAITRQEAFVSPEQKKSIAVPELMENLIEQISFEARDSEFIDNKSGVSARLSISGFENVMSTAERRMILNKEKKTTLRIGDLSGMIQSVTGKVELVYEGEQEGPYNVSIRLIGQAIRTTFPTYFPDPESAQRSKDANPYDPIIQWFNSNELSMEIGESNKEYVDLLSSVNGLQKLVDRYIPGLEKADKPLFMEFVLHALAEYSLISKHILDKSFGFSDLLNSIFSADDDPEWPSAN